MGLLDSIGRQYNEIEGAKSAMPYKPRGFKETIQDKIAYHKAQVDQLQAVIDSMTPEVEKFVEALQKVS